MIIQHHDSIVTALDLGLALNCQYDLSNRTILNDFDLVRFFFGIKNSEKMEKNVMHLTLLAAMPYQTSKVLQLRYALSNKYLNNY